MLTFAVYTFNRCAIAFLCFVCFRTLATSWILFAVFSMMAISITIIALCHSELRIETLCVIMEIVDIASVVYAVICHVGVVQIDDDGSAISIGGFIVFAAKWRDFENSSFWEIVI